jgi:hypothetical protein
LSIPEQDHRRRHIDHNRAANIVAAADDAAVDDGKLPIPREQNAGEDRFER